MIAATTAHVVVDHLLSNDGTIHATVTHEWWELTLAVIGAIAAALAAVWTLILAMQTKRLAEATAIVAKETSLLAQETARLASETRDAIAVSREEIAAEDRRHMDGFMPHIAIECRKRRYKRTTVTMLPGGRERSDVGLGPEMLVVTARNIGPGVALNIVASSNDMPTNERDMGKLPIALKPDGKRVLIIRKRLGAGSLMRWQITYEDAFGNKFESNIADDIQEYSRYTFRRLHD